MATRSAPSSKGSTSSARSPSTVADSVSPAARAASARTRRRRPPRRSHAARSDSTHGPSSSGKSVPRMTSSAARAAVRAEAYWPASSRSRASAARASSSTMSSQSASRAQPASVRTSRSGPRGLRRRLARTLTCSTGRTGRPSPGQRASSTSPVETTAPLPRARSFTSVRALRLPSWVGETPSTSNPPSRRIRNVPGPPGPTGSTRRF